MSSSSCIYIVTYEAIENSSGVFTDGIGHVKTVPFSWEKLPTFDPGNVSPTNQPTNQPTNLRMWGGLHDQSIIWTHPQWFVHDFSVPIIVGKPQIAPQVTTASFWGPIYTPAEKKNRFQFTLPLEGPMNRSLRCRFFGVGEKLSDGGAGVLMCIPRQQSSYSQGMIKGCSITSETHTLPETNIAGWKMHPLKMYFLFKMVIFHCYVRLPKGSL